LGTKNKKFKVGDLVRISDRTHWDGSEITRDGIVVGPGHYHESYMILFTNDGESRQFHGTFINLLSTANGEKINFNKKHLNTLTQ
jgi:hypothetical protein